MDVSTLVLRMMVLYLVIACLCSALAIQNTVNDIYTVTDEIKKETPVKKFEEFKSELIFISTVKPKPEPEPEESVTVEEPQDEPVEEYIEEPTVVTYFDIPLDEDLQDHIFRVCKNYNIDPALVIAMIAKESSYRPSVMGDGGKSYGLMQIQARYNQERMARLECPNLLDPYQNVSVGIDILSEKFEYGKPLEWVLMSYNGGNAYANRKWKNGEISDYVKKVFELRDELNTYEKELKS